MTTRDDILCAARNWLGTPWAHQASLRGIGCDCIGLIVGVARDCGIAEVKDWEADPLSRTYGRAPDPVALRAACERWLDPIALGDATLADILLLRFSRHPQHFALISEVEPRRIIHALSTARRVVEHGVDAAWARRIVGAWRYRGLEWRS